MTEKRFTVCDGFDGENNPIKTIEDTVTTEIYSMDNELEANSVCIKLNELNDENGRLQHFESIYRQRTLQLEKENEQLKQELKTKCIVNKQYEEYQRLIKMLDNVANYMQKQNKDMPIDDFVEWWNNIATKGLDDGDVE